MVFKVVPGEEDYYNCYDNGGAKMMLISGDIAYTPNGTNIGWVTFQSEEEALSYFNLTKADLELERLEKKMKDKLEAERASIIARREKEKEKRKS